MTEQKKCKDLIGEHLTSRIDDLRKLWTAYTKGDEEVPDLGRFNEYGLSFDYVAPGTFNGQRRGYFRYQISWGGPSDEFRFYCDERRKPVRVEYWFMDWFDGAKKVLHGKREALLLEIFEFFDEVGSVEAEYQRATEDE
jgi:hypothetical protein